MKLTEVHPGTPVDFDVLSKVSSTSIMESRSSNSTLVNSPPSPPPPVHRSASVSSNSKVTVATFLKAEAPPAPLPIDIRSPIAGLEPLPPIPYSLRTRKLSIAIVWTVIILDSVIMPIGLFFILKYGAGWTDVKNLALTNSIFGFVAFVQYALRLYRLLQPSPTYRPLDAPRWAFDMYQYQFTLGFILVTLMITFTTGPENLRLISLTPGILPAMCGPQFLVSCLCYRAGWKIPFNFSSTPKGSIAPPAVFTIVEDVVGVDGGGGRVFRAAWLRRYEASEDFREIMYKVTLFWGVGCFLFVAVTCAVVFKVESKYLAFGFGWSAPFVWAGIWAFITTKWVQIMLKEEKEAWDARGGRSAASVGMVDLPRDNVYP